MIKVDDFCYSGVEMPKSLQKFEKSSNMITLALFFCNSLTQCVCIQYNGSAFNFYCYEVGRLSEIESVELAKNFMMRDFW